MKSKEDMIKEEFISTYGKLPTLQQYIELFTFLVGDEGIEVSSHYIQDEHGVTRKELCMELKDYWSYEYDDISGMEDEYTFSVSGSFEMCILSAINDIDREFGNDHDYMSVTGDVEKILNA